MANVLRSQPRPSAPTAGMSAADQVKARRRANWDYLQRSVPQYAVCPPAAGAGTTQNYVAGQTLIYDVPTGMGAFLEGFLFEFALTVNPATGTGATYAKNAGAPWTLFDNFEVTYNRSQFKIKPLILPYLYQLAGYSHSKPGAVLASGQNVSNTGNSVDSTQNFAITTNTNNAWNWFVYVPLTWLPRMAAGMLPIIGDSTKCQMKVQCASSPLGPDPILNTVATTGGTGAAITMGGTVKVVARYRNGITTTQQPPLVLDLNQESTVQAVIDRQLNPLTAGSILRQKLDTKQKMIYALSIIVDGNQSTKFAADSNLASIELDMDSQGQNKFWTFGSQAPNLEFLIYRYFYRQQYGQDLDEGVIVWCAAPGNETINPGNMLGESYVDASTGKWIDLNYGVQVTSVTTTNFTPRVETYIIYENTLGLLTS